MRTGSTPTRTLMLEQKTLLFRPPFAETSSQVSHSGQRRKSLSLAIAWAVWSRLDQMDHELVWSRWTAGGWRMTSWVYPVNPEPGHDVDPDLAFDADGRPFLTWWRDDNGQSRVYLSLFLVTQWMIAYPVSEPGVNARFPSIVVLPDGEIVVTFETDEGIIEQTVLFDEPVTITDDIDPLDYISDGGTRYIGEATP